MGRYSDSFLLAARRGMKTTRELRIAIVPYSPTAHGFFAGKAVVESVPTDSFLLVVALVCCLNNIVATTVETRACLDVFRWCQVRDIRVLSQIAYGWSNSFVVHYHAIGPHNR
ncbi:putative aldo-keto reductase 1 [Camellia lanceoleosa]|uniref:Aldo-keto reductase 1 n=1 Tax=Camellia lanceoleosa TaxID=1840588 RepID=A0ACC0IDY8_9ERIC|nr:putative aldo-keto reductase 1 [Camellia lanceoleosa]